MTTREAVWDYLHDQHRRRWNKLSTVEAVQDGAKRRLRLSKAPPISEVRQILGELVAENRVHEDRFSLYWGGTGYRLLVAGDPGTPKRRPA